MTYDEVKNLKIMDIAIGATLLDLAKQNLSIVSSSTLKDNEIKMYVNAAVSDLERQGIDVENNINDGLVQGAIMMYLKANFGMVDIKEKELAQVRYIQTCHNLSLSEQYKKGDDENV